MGVDSRTSREAPVFTASSNSLITARIVGRVQPLRNPWTRSRDSPVGGAKSKALASSGWSIVSSSSRTQKGAVCREVSSLREVEPQ
jgi:hypothetical protein